MEDINFDIKQKIKTFGFKQYQVALCVGVSEATLTRWLRKPLSEEQTRKISLALITLQKERDKVIDKYGRGGD